MIYLRQASTRGKASFGWLNSKHSFSFGHYYDPEHMSFSALRVINDDSVAAGAGFDTHGHRDMEIISYVLEGAIEHEDSMGNRFVVPAGEVQRMSAGTGITHSEFNHSKTEELKFLQVWIIPNKKGVTPSYQQKSIEQTSKLTPLITPTGRDDTLSIQQDANVYRLALKPGESYEFDSVKRPGYLHVIEGQAHSGNVELQSKLAANQSTLLSAGDGVGILGEKLAVTAGVSELIGLWFDLPPQAG